MNITVTLKIIKFVWENVTWRK